MKKIFFYPVLFSSLSISIISFTLPVAASSLAQYIRQIKMGQPRALQKISHEDMNKLHTYQNKYYYIARFIGQKAMRSLFGCLANQDASVRKICADNLYQMKLTYVHKKVIAYYYRKESSMDTKKSLQDLLVKISEERFIEARRNKERNFLAKVAYNEISRFMSLDKDKSPGGNYSIEDLTFLLGGLANKSEYIRSFALNAMERILSPNMPEPMLNDALQTLTAFIQRKDINNNELEKAKSLLQQLKK